MDNLQPVLPGVFLPPHLHLPQEEGVGLGKIKLPKVEAGEDGAGLVDVEGDSRMGTAESWERTAESWERTAESTTWGT
jgi:hypothetical protein